MIVISTPFRAFGRPAADVAVLDGLGVCRRRRVGRRCLVGQRRQETVAGAPVVGHVVVDAQPLDRAGAAAEGDVEPLGTDALDAFELVHVRADLEDRARLDVARELGVRHLVVVRAPARRAFGRIDPEEEVGVAAERAVEERRLVDDVVARGHGIDRRCRGRAELVATVRDRPIRLDLDGDSALGAQVREVPGFVLETALADDIELRVVADRPLHEPGDGRALELGQMLAGEEGDKVRGGVDGSAVDAIHSTQP